MNRCRLPLAVLALVVSAACSRVPPLESSHASANGLATAVLDALARRDRAALEALAVSETEFRDHVWPELPAARPERNLPFSYVWGDLRQKSAGGLENALVGHGGRRYELVGVTLSGRTDYASYTVHRAATFRVREPSGEQTDLRVCGSLIEKNGGWKVFSYVVDD